MAEATSEEVFTIQTDTVLSDTPSTVESDGTDSTRSDTRSPIFTSATATTTDDDVFTLDPDSTLPYTGTCATPLNTGNRPYWAKSGYDPYNCGASVILLNWTTYCCNGNLIDLTQPLGAGNGFKLDHELCFENMRCCSGDPAVTHGTATSCTVGTEARMPLESSVSSEFYASASSTTTEDDPFSTITSPASSATASNTPSSATNPTPMFPLLSVLLLLAVFAS